MGYREKAVALATEAYVDERTGVDLLWTNASPTSAQPAQDINFNTAGYNEYLIEVRMAVTDNVYLYERVKAVPNRRITLRFMGYYSYYREVNVKENGFSIGVGKRLIKEATTADQNDAMVITNVYGIK